MPGFGRDGPAGRAAGGGRPPPAGGEGRCTLGRGRWGAPPPGRGTIPGLAPPPGDGRGGAGRLTLGRCGALGRPPPPSGRPPPPPRGPIGKAPSANSRKAPKDAIQSVFLVLMVSPLRSAHG